MLNNYEFRVLCLDDGDSCEFVKQEMADFYINENPKFPGYDHSGRKRFSTDQEAQERRREIMKACKEQVLKVDIYEAV